MLIRRSGTGSTMTPGRDRSANYTGPGTPFRPACLDFALRGAPVAPTGRDTHMSLLRTALALALAAGCATPALANETHGWVYNGMTGPSSLRADGIEGSRFVSNPII